MRHTCGEYLQCVPDVCYDRGAPQIISEVNRFWSLRHALLDPKTELMNETKTAITPDENPTA